MKRFIILLLAIVFIFACKGGGTLKEVRSKWGPPAKVEETEDSIMWFYYFQEGTDVWGRPINRYVVVEIVADKNGNVLDKRKYWRQPEEEPKKPTSKIAGGTGFLVSPDGYIVTAFHIIRDAKRIEVKCEQGEWLEAVLWKKSGSTDIAVLKINMNTPNFLTLAGAKEYEQGQKVFTIGFPVIELLGYEPKYTEGSISSLSGIEGEDSLMQITVPVQPGNSGGPLINKDGKVVGLITSSVAIQNFYRKYGTVPQNINWAVKSTYISILLENQNSRPKDIVNMVEFTKKCVCLIKAK
jgi:S1-C subfamily serine protease